jgi:TetR/AcrR family transcriptional regulator, lmrAB and yxaGH operons repressor
MPSATDRPREKMIESAVQLMRERGVENTSFSAVIMHSGAPRGSIYHYFPGGKAQLIEEAVRWSGGLITSALHQLGPLEFIDLWPGFWRPILENSEFAAGCPIAAGSMEGERHPNVRAAASEVFAEWQDVLSDGLVSRGVPADRARSLAVTAFAAIEGAVLLARSQRSMEPVERTTAEIRTLVADALATVESDGMGADHRADLPA